MHKNVQTYYAIIPVEERLPDDEKYYGTILKNDSFNNDYKPFDTGTTHWLSKQQGVVLSVEEWEKVQKCFKDAIECIEDLCTPRRMDWRKNKAWQQLQALSQLNTKP